MKNRILSYALSIVLLLGLLPIAAHAADTSGKCGDNLTWTYDASSRLLTISGTGDMYDYLSNRDSTEAWIPYCTQIKAVSIEDGATSIGSGAFSDCTNITSVRIPSTLISIGADAFSNCTNLNSICIPQGVTDIGGGAFEQCVSIKSIIIPWGVTVIEQWAFSYCTSLKNVSIPSSVTYINSYSFAYCTGLTYINIPSGVTSIDEGVFSHCTSLKSLSIPLSMKNIGSYTFNECNNLTQVYYEGSENEWNKINISGWYCKFYLIKATIYYNVRENGATESYSPAASYVGYYRATVGKTFRIIDPSAPSPRASGFDVNVNGTTCNTGESGDITIDIPDDYSGSVVISKDGYHTYTMPNALISEYNVVTMLRDSGDAPFFQSVLLNNSTDSYKSFTNLRVYSACIYENSLDTYEILADVNWNGNQAGRVWLQQGDTVIPITDGTTGSVDLGLMLTKDGGDIYACAETADGRIVRTKIQIKLYQKMEKIPVNLGENVEAAIDDNVEALGGMECKVSLKDSVVPIELSLSEDGTFKGSIGLKLFAASDKMATFGTIKDLFKSVDSDGNHTAVDEEKIQNCLDMFEKTGDLSVVPQYCSFGVSGELCILGYVEGKIEDGHIIFTETGMMLSVSAAAKYTQQTLWFGEIPGYWQTELEGKIETSLKNVQSDETGQLHISSDIGFKGELSLKTGPGVGVPGILSAGISGKGTLTLDGVLPYQAEKSYWYLQISTSVDANTLGFDHEVQFYKSKKLDIYKGSEVTEAAENAVSMSVSQLGGSGAFTQAPRDYIGSASDFQANSSGPSLSSLAGEDSPLTAAVIKSNTYTHSDPQLATLSDGTEILVWVEDDGAANRPIAINRTALFYSVLNPSTGMWSAQNIVEEDYTADFDPVLKVVNDEALLVWLDSNTVFDSDDVTLSKVAGSMGVSFAQFDNTSGTFGNIAAVSADSNLDMLADVTLVQGQPSVEWVCNTNNDIFCGGGNTSIQSAVYDGKSWIESTLATGLQAVDGLSAASVLGDLQVFFSQDTDNSAGTASDKEIYRTMSGSTVRMTTNDTADTKPFCEDGILYWCSDGGISTMELDSGTTNFIPMEANTDRYQYLTGTNGTDAILYSTTDDTLTGNIYAVFNDGSGWGAPIPITESSANIENFSSAFLPNGTLAVADNERVIGSDGKLGQANIELYKLTPSCDISVSNANYGMYSLVPGSNLEMSADVANKGASTVQFCEIDILDSAGNTLDTQYNSLTLLSGDTIKLSFSFALPQNITDNLLTVRVLPLGLTDRNTSDNTADCILKPNDVSIETVSAEETGNDCYITALIANRGLAALDNIVVSVHDGSAGGAVLDTKTVASLLVQGTTLLSFEVPNEKAGNILYVEANEQTNENIIENNSNFAEVISLDNKGLTVSGSDVERSADGKLLNMTVNADNDIGTNQTVSFVVAAYSNGKLLDIKIIGPVNIEALDSYCEAVSLACGQATGNISIKILSLNNLQELTPLTEPWTKVVAST